MTFKNRTNHINHYGKHSRLNVKFYNCARVVSYGGLSPAMCEARRNDWSWRGQHRDKGWPWQMTMERLMRHLASREASRLINVPPMPFLPGYSFIKNDVLVPLYDFTYTSDINFAAEDLNEVMKTSVNREITLEIELKDINPKVMSILGFDIGEMWEHLASFRRKKCQK